MTTRYARHADMRLTALDDEGVVLQLGTRSYFTVTATGLTILETMRSPATFDELVAAVLAEYEVEREKAETSVRQFLQQCLDAAVVTAVEG